MADLQAEFELLKANKTCDTASSEVIINKVAERQRRVSNIIVFNTPESDDTNSDVCKQHDMEFCTSSL